MTTANSAFWEAITLVAIVLGVLIASTAHVKGWLPAVPGLSSTADPADPAKKDRRRRRERTSTDPADAAASETDVRDAPSSPADTRRRRRRRSLTDDVSGVNGTGNASDGGPTTDGETTTGGGNSSGNTTPYAASSDPGTPTSYGLNTTEEEREREAKLAFARSQASQAENKVSRHVQTEVAAQALDIGVFLKLGDTASFEDLGQTVYSGVIEADDPLDIEVDPRQPGRQYRADSPHPGRSGFPSFGLDNPKPGAGGNGGRLPIKTDLSQQIGAGSLASAAPGAGFANLGLGPLGLRALTSREDLINPIVRPVAIGDEYLRAGGKARGEVERSLAAAQIDKLLFGHTDHNGQQGADESLVSVPGIDPSDLGGVAVRPRPASLVDLHATFNNEAPFDFAKLPPLPPSPLADIVKVRPIPAPLDLQKIGIAQQSLSGEFSGDTVVADSGDSEKVPVKNPHPDKNGGGMRELELEGEEGPATLASSLRLEQSRSPLRMMDVEQGEAVKDAPENAAALEILELEAEKLVLLAEVADQAKKLKKLKLGKKEKAELEAATATTGRKMAKSGKRLAELKSKQGESNNDEVNASRSEEEGSKSKNRDKKRSLKDLAKSSSSPKSKPSKNKVLEGTESPQSENAASGSDIAAKTKGKGEKKKSKKKKGEKAGLEDSRSQDSSGSEEGSTASAGEAGKEKSKRKKGEKPGKEKKSAGDKQMVLADASRQAKDDAESESDESPKSRRAKREAKDEESQGDDASDPGGRRRIKKSGKGSKSGKKKKSSISDGSDEEEFSSTERQRDRSRSTRDRVSREGSRSKTRPRDRSRERARGGEEEDDYSSRLDVAPQRNLNRRLHPQESGSSQMRPEVEVLQSNGRQNLPLPNAEDCQPAGRYPWQQRNREVNGGKEDPQIIGPDGRPIDGENLVPVPPVESKKSNKTPEDEDAPITAEQEQAAAAGTKGGVSEDARRKRRGNNVRPESDTASLEEARPKVAKKKAEEEAEGSAPPAEKRTEVPTSDGMEGRRRQREQIRKKAAGSQFTPGPKFGEAGSPVVVDVETRSTRLDPTLDSPGQNDISNVVSRRPGQDIRDDPEGFGEEWFAREAERIEKIRNHKLPEPEDARGERIIDPPISPTEPLALLEAGPAAAGSDPEMDELTRRLNSRSQGKKGKMEEDVSNKVPVHARKRETTPSPQPVYSHSNVNGADNDRQDADSDSRAGWSGFKQFPDVNSHGIHPVMRSPSPSSGRHPDADSHPRRSNSPDPLPHDRHGSVSKSDEIVVPTDKESGMESSPKSERQLAQNRKGTSADLEAAVDTPPGVSRRQSHDHVVDLASPAAPSQDSSRKVALTRSERLNMQLRKGSTPINEDRALSAEVVNLEASHTQPNGRPRSTADSVDLHIQDTSPRVASKSERDQPTSSPGVAGVQQRPPSTDEGHVSTLGAETAIQIHQSRKKLGKGEKTNKEEDDDLPRVSMLGVDLSEDSGDDLKPGRRFNNAAVADTHSDGEKKGLKLKKKKNKGAERKRKRKREEAGVIEEASQVAAPTPQVVRRSVQARIGPISLVKFLWMVTTHAPLASFFCVVSTAGILLTGRQIAILATLRSSNSDFVKRGGIPPDSGNLLATLSRVADIFGGGSTGVFVLLNIWLVFGMLFIIGTCSFAVFVAELPKEARRYSALLRRGWRKFKSMWGGIKTIARWLWVIPGHILRALRIGGEAITMGAEWRNPLTALIRGGWGLSGKILVPITMISVTGVLGYYAVIVTSSASNETRNLNIDAQSGTAVDNVSSTISPSMAFLLLNVIFIFGIPSIAYTLYWLFSPRRPKRSTAAARNQSWWKAVLFFPMSVRRRIPDWIFNPIFVVVIIVPYCIVLAKTEWVFDQITKFAGQVSGQQRMILLHSFLFIMTPLLAMAVLKLENMVRRVRRVINF